MEKIDELNQELAELRSKYNAETAKYNTKVTRKAVLVFSVLSIIAGLAIGYYVFHKNTEIMNKPITETVKTETKTEVVYTPKVANEKTDVEANIGKQQLYVKVNGQEQVIQKKDDEQYVLDKNKIQLNQTSQTTLDINVPTVDKTRRWGVGVGLSDNGIAYNVKFPIKRNMGGWAFHDNDTTAAGIMIEF